MSDNQTECRKDQLVDLGEASVETRGVFKKWAEESTGLPDYRD